MLTPYMIPSQRVTKVPIHLRTFAVLHFLNHGSYQLGVGHGYSATGSQSVISRNIAEVTDIMTTHFLNVWIKFPTSDEKINAIKEGFASTMHFLMLWEQLTEPTLGLWHHPPITQFILEQYIIAEKTFMASTLK
jgi:hypothetical protein